MLLAGRVGGLPKVVPELLLAAAALVDFVADEDLAPVVGRLGGMATSDFVVGPWYLAFPKDAMFGGWS